MMPASDMPCKYPLALGFSLSGALFWDGRTRLPHNLGRTGAQKLSSRLCRASPPPGAPWTMRADHHRIPPRDTTCSNHPRKTSSALPLDLKILPLPQRIERRLLFSFDRGDNGGNLMLRCIETGGGNLRGIEQSKRRALLPIGVRRSLRLSGLIGFSFFAGLRALPFTRPGYRSRPPAPPRSRSSLRLARYQLTSAFRFASRF